MENGKKYCFIVILLIIIILGLGGTYCYSIYGIGNESENFNNEKRMLNFVGKTIYEVQEYANSNGIVLKIDYQYSSEISNDVIISQSLKVDSLVKEGDICSLVVSKGKVPVSIYRENKVNELGNVPIMMYHGIVNKMNNETSYVGGNVDKDGYQRTVEAFRGDLEFYYKNGYRMIRLEDYIDGKINVELGYSPIILTFDDGNENNFKVLGEENGELIIDPNSAIGVLEEFKKKYPDYGVTATFFVNEDLFNQEKYNIKILNWLIKHGYDIGNHTINHVDFTTVDYERSVLEVGLGYVNLNKIIPDSYVSIVALPFGSPYKTSHDNFSAIVSGIYNGFSYQTKGILRVGWEAEVSCFDKSFNPMFLKRIRAYDNNGVDFDIEMNFTLLEKKRYISDGDEKTIVVREVDYTSVKDSSLNIVTYS